MVVAITNTPSKEKVIGPPIIDKMSVTVPLLSKKNRN